MATKAFSIEDGNLQTKSIITSRQKLYNDIDLSFINRPSGDLYKKTDAAAVKQSIKNILLTNTTEKPFKPYYGGSLNDFLFNLSEDFDEFELEEQINNAISNYEPRAIVRQINVNLAQDNYSIEVTVIFQIVSTTETVQLDISIARLR